MRFVLAFFISSVAILGCRKQQPSHAANTDAANPTNTADAAPAATDALVPQRSHAPTPSRSDAPAPAPLQPLPPPPKVVAARADNYLRETVTGTADPFLTGELRNFVQQKKRLPESFAEFAGLRLDSIPRPPEGKKWVIDVSTLEVKAVSAR